MAMYTIYETDELEAELVNTDALISDYAFQYRIWQMHQKLDTDDATDKNSGEE